jgi:uncharacterized protein YndB with AHSA1/START domain
MTDLTLTARRIIGAEPKRVFEAWLDPVLMQRFMAPGPGMHVREARADARVGGRFHIMMVGDKDYPHDGTYKEITPYSRLVFTWETAWSAPDTTVEITFTPVQGGTEVELTHTRFVSEQSRDNHLEGWTAILQKLAETLG